MDASPAIVGETLFRRFGNREILKGVYFRAMEGAVTAVLGANGCGKTTLFRILAGTLRAHAGRLVYRGRLVPRPSLARLAREGLFYLPQDRLLLDDLALETQLRSFSPQVSASVPVEMLELRPFLRKKPRTLSDGERRRADLAAAMLRRPKILLMDEPFTGIAPVDADRIMTTLRAMAASGTAVVITDHSIEWTLNAADEVWFLDEGSCRRIGDRHRAAKDPELRARYLGNRKLNLR